MSKKPHVGRIFVIANSPNDIVTYVVDTDALPVRCKVLAIVEDTGKITFVGGNTAKKYFDGETLTWHISGCISAVKTDCDPGFGRRTVPPTTVFRVTETTAHGCEDMPPLYTEFARAQEVLEEVIAARAKLSPIKNRKDAALPNGNLRVEVVYQVTVRTPDFLDCRDGEIVETKDETVSYHIVPQAVDGTPATSPEPVETSTN